MNYGVYRAWGMLADSIEELEQYRNYCYGHVCHREEAREHEPAEGIVLLAPTVVLIGRKTGSAAEDFLIMADELEALERAVAELKKKLAGNGA